MNREIKVRFWDEESKSISDGYTLKELKKLLQNATNGECQPHEFLLLFAFNDLIEMQYTGLKDKNGKEIYESDILSGHSDGNVKVEWSNENAGWDCIFSEGSNIGMAEMCSWFGNNSIIIGNIYENPELC